jgi:type II secretory pathway predicted ATPase ExeA
MQLSYWGIRESPFGMQQRDRFFFASPTHDEALARLGFLVDSGQSLGILAGYEGTGRSLVLEMFARDMRRQGHCVCSINLVGLDQHEFLWTLAAGLGCNPRAHDEGFPLARRIRDRLRADVLTDRMTILILDDAEQASHEVLTQILRLLKTHPYNLTLILAIESSRMARLGTDLLQLSQLRIRLEPWNHEDICQYLQTGLAYVGCQRSIFEESATERLAELTDGIPRWVSQLAELALLAAASQQRQCVDGRIIEEVYQQLSASFEEDLQAATY